MKKRLSKCLERFSNAPASAAKSLMKILVRANCVVTKIALGAIRTYQRALSPGLGHCCRFYPSCSEYGLEAIRRKGLAAGALLTAARLLRCHPFCPGGYDDPAPQ